MWLLVTRPTRDANNVGTAAATGISGTGQHFDGLSIARVHLMRRDLPGQQINTVHSFSARQSSSKFNDILHLKIAPKLVTKDRLGHVYTLKCPQHSNLISLNPLSIVGAEAFKLICTWISYTSLPDRQCRSPVRVPYFLHAPTREYYIQNKHYTFQKANISWSRLSDNLFRFTLL